MAEIKLSDGTLLKTKEPVTEILQMMRARDRLLLITDRNEKKWHVNRDQIVFLRDA